MTSATVPHAPTAITFPRSLERVVRLHLITWLRTLGWPWAILSVSFAINLALFSALDYKAREGSGTGGLASIYIVLLIAYLQIMNQSFPFALGMGVSRRSFFFGTAVFAAAESLAYGALIYLLSVIEVATGGWGVDLDFFRVRWLSGGNPLELLLIYTVPLFCLACLAMAHGLVNKRWGTNGLLTLSAAWLLVLGGTAVLITWLDGWRAFGTWFADQSPLSLAAGWPALLAAVALGAGYLLIRRATP